MSKEAFDRIIPLLRQAYWLEGSPMEAKMVAVLFAIFGLDDVYGEPQPCRIAVRD